MEPVAVLTNMTGRTLTVTVGAGGAQPKTCRLPPEGRITVKCSDFVQLAMGDKVLPKKKYSPGSESISPKEFEEGWYQYGARVLGETLEKGILVLCWNVGKKVTGS
jgi:hypothetical protein